MSVCGFADKLLLSPVCGPCCSILLQVSVDPTGGLKPEQRETDVSKHDPADEVLLSDGLGHKFVSIPGMDNFFTYQLEYKRVRVFWGLLGGGGGQGQGAGAYIWGDVHAEGY
jgi:hypothetical protein